MSYRSAAESRLRTSEAEFRPSLFHLSPTLPRFQNFIYPLNALSAKSNICLQRQECIHNVPNVPNVLFIIMLNGIMLSIMALLKIPAIKSGSCLFFPIRQIKVL
jgi:hypothetical protein